MVSLAAEREERLMERWYTLMVGDLDHVALSALESLSDAELETFFKLRKRVKARVADQLFLSQ